MAAAVVLFGMLLGGCEENIDPLSPNQLSGSDNPLVLPSGLAWTECNGYSSSNCGGAIFTEDGRVVEVGRYYGEWERGSIGTYTIRKQDYGYVSW